MSRGDLLGAALMLATGLSVGALWVAERSLERPPTAKASPLLPSDAVSLPNDEAVYEVLRGDTVVGTIEAEQGRATDGAPGAAYYLRRSMSLNVSRLSFPGVEIPEHLAVASDLVANLAADLTLLTFRFTATGPAGPLAEAKGTVSGAMAHVSFRLGATADELDIPLASPPLIEEAALALLASSGALDATGARFRLPILNPQTGDPHTLILEVAAPETVTLATGERFEAVEVIRDAGDGLIRSAWVDLAGRVVREELPLGLIAVRRHPPGRAGSVP